MFVSEKPLSGGRVGVKQVDHEAGHSQAFQGAGPHLPASSQLQPPPAAGALLPLRPPRLLCPSEKKKKKERGTAAKGHQGSESVAETGQGLGKLVDQGLASLSWAGQAPYLL